MDVSVFCLSTFMSMEDSCQHTRARTCRVTHTPLRCGGDECDVDSLSLLGTIIHTNMHDVYVCVCVCAYVIFFLLF
jgi:hypothetical protein